MEKYIQYKNWKLFYTCKGTIDKPPLLLFHGFGQTNKIFDNLLEPIQDKYTCYCFDLFYHGKSKAPEHEVLSIKTFDKIFALFLAEEGIQNFSTAGFSIGAKFSVSLLMEHPDRISKAIFMAPDGLIGNMWYKVATYPYLTRMLFKSLIDQPGWFIGTINLLTRISLLNKSLGRFVLSQLKSTEQRKKLYQSWTAFRNLSFSTRSIESVINKHSIPTVIYAGKYDKVIPANQFTRFCKNIPTCDLVILNCGHNDLINTVAQQLSKQ